MKKIILSAASLAVAAVASVSVVPTTAEAVPAFARQTGAACLNCHFGAIPRLAQMGREFRMNGFRDLSQDAVEDEHLSIPAFFNASLLMKARVQVNRGDAGLTELQWPDESALLFGGRFGEHAGGLQEWDVIGGTMLGAFMGWQALPFIILLSSVTGAIIGSIALLLAKKGLQAEIPYGPYLAAAGIIWFFWSAQILYWYQTMILG